MSKLEIKSLLNWEDVEPYRSRWNELVEQSLGFDQGAASIFQTFEWHEAWWEAFGSSSGFELLVLAAFEGTTLVGLAPLMISRRRLPIPTRVIQFIGSENFASDFCAFIVAPDREDAIAAFIDWIKAHPEKWNEIDFVNILEGGAIASNFEAPFKIHHRFLYDAPTRLLGNSDDDRKVVNKKSLKRHFNWFERQGTLAFQHLSDIEKIESELDTFFAQHVARRSLTGAASQFKDAKQRRFFRALVKYFAPRNMLRFSRVTLNDEPVAYHFGFECAGRYYWYKPSFAVKYWKKSPGEVLLKFLLEYSLEKKLKEFDFTVGNEAFKYRFANRLRKAYRFRVFRTWPQYAMFQFFSALRALKRRRTLDRPSSEPGSGADEA